MDIFNEKIVKRNKGILDVLLIIGVIILAIIAAAFLFLNMKIFFYLLTPVLIYIVYYVITSTNIEYEYAVTNGDLDVDAIIDQRKRKRLLSHHCREFELVARLDSSHYSGRIRDCKNVKDYSSRGEDAEKWFVFMKKEGKNLVIIFEPSNKMIDNFAMYNPRIDT